MFCWPGSRDFHYALGPPAVWKPAPQSDPTSDSPGITTASRTRSRGSMGLARVEAIAGPGQSAGSSGAGHRHWVLAEKARSFYSLGPRGAEGRCCWGHFPGNLAPPPPERGLRYFRMETVPWPRGVVLPRWPLRPRNFQTEVMTCGGAGYMVSETRRRVRERRPEPSG